MHVGRAISNLHICGTSTFMVIAYSLKHPNDVKTPYFLNYTIRVSFKMKEMGGGDIMINALGVHSVLVISIHTELYMLLCANIYSLVSVHLQLLAHKVSIKSCNMRPYN